MARPEKERLVTEIKDKLTSAEGVYLTDFKGLNVEEISDLRNQLRQASIEFKVVKNTLARISVNQAGYDDLIKYLDGPTAMAFCLSESTVGAKILTEFQKKNSKLELKACIFEGQVIDKNRIDEIAKLPAREQIIAQTMGTISAPLRNMVGVLNNVLVNLVTVLNEIKNQREN
jgi:large subunit ribosomal protein L10